MVGQPVSIGPFFGGLNTVNDPSTIEDVQCAVLNNFDIDTDGSIIARPAVGYEQWSAVYDISILCTYTVNDQTFIAISRRGGSPTFNEVFEVIDIATGIRTQIAVSSGIARYTAAVQYDDKLWFTLTDESTTTGGYWTPNAGKVDVPGMPRGSTMLIYKERMFIASKGGRVYFSKIADPTNWLTSSDAGGFFDVDPGDGDEILTMISHMGQIVIFKHRSTYVFAYDNAPDRAVVQQVSNSIGTESIKSVTTYEGIIYTLHDNKLYAVNNWRWVDVSQRIRIFDPPNNPIAPNNYRTGVAAVSVIGRRIFVRYRTKYFVYFPDLEAWSTWEFQSSQVPDYWVMLPHQRSDGYYEYWAGCRNHIWTQNTTNRIWKLVDGYSPENPFADDFVATVGTKMYDYELPHSFKRLHWWGVDLKTTSTIDVKVYPETYNTKITWDDFAALGITWDQAAAEGRTWDRPVDLSINVTDSASMGYTAGIRTFLKFLKSLRFRKVSYEISYRYNHDAQKQPLRIFSAMAVISGKQLVPRKTN